MTEMSMERARQVLVEAHPATAGRALVARRGPSFWFFTYDVAAGQLAPLGAPSWLVLDSGECGPVRPREQIRVAIDRLRDEP